MVMPPSTHIRRTHASQRRHPTVLLPRGCSVASNRGHTMPAASPTGLVALPTTQLIPVH